jgi:DNA-binding LytR/AlgR family response regulator
MTTKAIVIDDEPLAHEIIRSYSENIKTLEIKAYCNDALEALEILNQEQINLIFLDVNMPKLSGIDFLKTITNPPLVILTTAYTEYALEGYELNILDYLTKPFSFSRFLKAVRKAEGLLSLQNSPETGGKKGESIFIKSNKKNYQVHFNEIVYIEGLGDYIKLYTEKTHLVTNIPMKKMEELLPHDLFLRIHKSFIINLKKIISIEGNIVEISSQKLVVGHNYRTKFFERINKMMA